MRRIISFFLCLLTVLFLLAGCGNRAQDQEEDAQTDEEGIDHGEEEGCWMFPLIKRERSCRMIL